MRYVNKESVEPPRFGNMTVKPWATQENHRWSGNSNGDHGISRNQNKRPALTTDNNGSTLELKQNMSNQPNWSFTQLKIAIL